MKFKSPAERWKDKRLKMIKNEWFNGKRVLDIGCHTGDLTLMITLLYKPELIIGVDIDHKLISGGIKQMHKIANEIEIT
jgi:7SK snRNA methylphosphate capping enzyme